eukprot:COSAG01_NODE_12062_length_1806_cov_1.605741_1_plen_62_part_10
MGFAIAGSALLLFFMEVYGACSTPGFSKDDKLNEWRINNTLLEVSIIIKGWSVSTSHHLLLG